MLDTKVNIAVDADHAAVFAACEPGTGLCTVVGIDGSFSRDVGAQLAVKADGTTVGSLADGCLEQQLANDLLALDRPVVRRYGRGSDVIDFRLPCGGGLDIHLHPAPDHKDCEAVVANLARRKPASFEIALENGAFQRRYIPALNVRVFGEGPELVMLTKLAEASRADVTSVRKDRLSLGAMSGLPSADPYTAVVLLFHDHEWEAALLEEALGSDAFYIGAQGGENARVRRYRELLMRGVPEENLSRITSPIGLIENCKNPEALAVSAFAQIVERYERLRTASR